MARGPKKHLKRLDAPKHWMLDKMAGSYATRPRAGPHKLRECLPLIIFLRNRLKYALTGREAMLILKDRNVLVDNKIRTDIKFPAGFMDVISLPKVNEHYRLMFDVKGRYIVHAIKPEEAKFKLGKVVKRSVGDKGVPYIVTHDGRTFRYPDPALQVGDTVKINLETSTLEESVAFEVGVQVIVTNGRNMGRVGIVTSRERHPGSFDVVHVKDSIGHQFATRLSNTFVIGAGGSAKPLVALPKGKGVKLTIAEERDRRLEKSKATA
eukprot:m.220676 g.220676  ORF g.220676 m.220676 type:complete len:266 (-) comp15625_c0_seq1:127-924(-)